MSTVRKLLHLSTKLKEHLEQGMGEERDDYIAETERLLAERQALLESLPGEYTEEEKEMGKHIVEMNESINARLKHQFQFLKGEVEKLQQSKHRTERYTNPYKHLASDGMYFDKKK